MEAQKRFLGIPAYSMLWKPKNHFATHIPGDILRFGPPRTYWCMRFEAKNQEHKASARHSNFKNTPKTVAKFWAERSAHMLQKKQLKRKRTTEMTAPGELHHEGMTITSGTWILMSGGSSPQIAYVREVLAKENGEVALRISAFDAASILWRHDGIPFAYLDSVRSGGNELVVPSIADVAGITILLPIEYKDKVSFVEQP